MVKLKKREIRETDNKAVSEFMEFQKNEIHSHETSYAYNRIAYDAIRKISPIIRLIERYISIKNTVPKVILIPESKMKKYTIDNIYTYSMHESVLGVKIRFYKGTKTEVY